jgi:hypothetical protein
MSAQGSQIWQIILQLGVQSSANCQSSFKDPDLDKKIQIQLGWEPYPYHGFTRTYIHTYISAIYRKNWSFLHCGKSGLFTTICQNSALNGPQKMRCYKVVDRTWAARRPVPRYATKKIVTGIYKLLQNPPDLRILFLHLWVCYSMEFIALNDEDDYDAEKCDLEK